MTRLLVLVVVAAALVATVFAWSRSAPSAASPAARTACASKRLPPATPAGQSAQWGHIKSLMRKGGRFELRFDPALWLGGPTAQRAAVQDGRLRPGEPVPNDYYVVDESHRLLTYFVPMNARVTVLTNATCATPISVSELAQIVKGKNPKHRPLYDRGNHLGYWLRIGYRYDSAVRSLDQQYQP